jgi:hypothetical protein
MKAFFLSRLLREKILLVALAVAVAAVWLNAAGKRADRLWRDVRNTSTDLQEQELVLAEKAPIEARAVAAVARLDPARTYDPVRLQSEVNTIATAAGLGAKANIGDARTERANQFAVNTVQVTIRNADYAALVTFYLELKKRAPYLGLENFDVFASPANPASLTAAMRVSSVEIAK